MKNESKKIIDKYEENIEKLMKEINILKEELDKKDEIYKNELINMKNEYDMKISLKKEKYDKEMMKLNNNYQKAIEDKEREIKFNENKLRKLKEENMNNIKKFEEYLKILEKRISFVNNEITIIYKINKNENFVKIFDEYFAQSKKRFL